MDNKHITSELTLGKGRIFYFDLIKCIGIICVIYGHVELFGFGLKGGVATDLIYTFNMPIFFFVSGYLAFKSRKSINYYLDNTWKKVTMLMFPTIFFSLFWALVRKSGVDFTEGFGKYWFGCALLECFAIYYIVCIVIKTEKQQLALMTLLSIAGIGYLSIGVGDKYLEAIELNHLTKYLHFFTLGMFAKHFAKIYNQILESQSLKTIGVSIFFILFFALRYDGVFPTIVERFLNDILLRYLGLYICVMFLYELSKGINAQGKVARLVGLVAENSFGIYLLQYFFLPDFRGQEWFCNIDPYTMFIICTLFTFVCTIVCLGVISILSKSNTISRYVLGKR